MLKGTVKYYDKELKQEVAYGIWGYSFESNISMVLSSITSESSEYFTRDTENPIEQFKDKRTVEIYPTNTKVETTVDEDKVKAHPTTRVLPSLMGIAINFMIKLGKQNYVKVDKEYTEDGYVKYSYKQSGVYLDPKDEEESDVLGYIEYPRNASPFNLRKLDFQLNTFEFHLEEVSDRDTASLPYVEAKHTVSFKVDSVFKALGLVDTRINNATNTEEKGMFLKSFDEVLERYPNKQIKWILDQDYEMVTDKNVKEIVAKLKRYPYLGVDTETTGLGITFKSKTFEDGKFSSQLVGVIISGKVGESYFFPLRMNTVPNLCQGDHVRAMHKYIEPLLQKPILLFNSAFDTKVFMIYDIQINLKLDVMVALQDTIGYEENIRRVSLKQMTSRLLGRDAIEINELTRTGTYEGATFSDVPEELILAYACPDADNTLALYEYIKRVKLLETHGANKVVDLDSQFTLCIAYQEFYGQHIDVDKMPELRKELRYELSHNKEIMIDVINKKNAENKKNGKPAIYDPSKFNPNSTPQILKVVYDGLNAPIQSKFDKNTRRTKPTLDKNARKTLLGVLKEGSLAYTFVKALKDYNDSNTMVKNFTKNMPTMMTPDGYTFSSVNQFLNTGRLSTKNPPYQNYSKPIKKYITPRKGFGMSDNDFQSIEYKVIAGLSHEPRLLKAFQDPNTDYHRLQASNMYKIPYELITDAQRKSAKKFNFGIPFGMGAQTLGEQLMGERSAENTEYANKMLKRYFQGQEHVKAFFTNRRNQAVAQGYSETLFGRRRYYDKRKESEGSIRRKSGNQPIQGTAADMFKFATVRLYYTILKRGLMGKVLMSGFIHDEMLLEVHKSINPIDWLAILKDQVELRMEGFPPIYLGWGYGASWYQAKMFDIPTALQNELIANGAEKEYPQWKEDGDPKKFNEWLIKRSARFEHEQILNFLTDKENEGKAITPVLWGYLESDIDDLPEVQEAHKTEKRIPINEQIQLFKDKFQLEYVVTLHDPNQDDTDKAEDTPEDTDTSYDISEDEEVKEQEDKNSQRYKLDYLNMYGSYYDVKHDRIIVKYDEYELQMVERFCKTKPENEYYSKVYIYKQDENKLYETQVYGDYEILFKGQLESLYRKHIYA